MREAGATLSDVILPSTQLRSSAQKLVKVGFSNICDVPEGRERGCQSLAIRWELEPIVRKIRRSERHGCIARDRLDGGGTRDYRRELGVNAGPNLTHFTVGSPV
jgi:hypothetical protein